MIEKKKIDSKFRADFNNRRKTPNRICVHAFIYHFNLHWLLSMFVVLFLMLIYFIVFFVLILPWFLFSKIIVKYACQIPKAKQRKKKYEKYIKQYKNAIRIHLCMYNQQQDNIIEWYKVLLLHIWHEICDFRKIHIFHFKYSPQKMEVSLDISFEFHSHEFQIEIREWNEWKNPKQKYVRIISVHWYLLSIFQFRAINGCRMKIVIMTVSSMTLHLIKLNRQHRICCNIIRAGGSIHAQQHKRIHYWMLMADTNVREIFVKKRIKRRAHYSATYGACHFNY